MSEASKRQRITHISGSPLHNAASHIGIRYVRYGHIHHTYMHSCVHMGIYVTCMSPSANSGALRHGLHRVHGLRLPHHRGQQRRTHGSLVAPSAFLFTESPTRARGVVQATRTEGDGLIRSFCADIGVVPSLPGPEKFVKQWLKTIISSQKSKCFTFFGVQVRALKFKA